jgi:hypothetical protein
LLEERIHALAELGQLRLRTLAPKEITAELVLQVLYARVSDGCVTLQRSAALVKFSSLTVARKYLT